MGEVLPGLQFGITIMPFGHETTTLPAQTRVREVGERDF